MHEERMFEHGRAGVNSWPVRDGDIHTLQDTLANGHAGMNKCFRIINLSTNPINQQML
jgi:hypothetical protein